jgi:hypothetical protein
MNKKIKSSGIIQAGLFVALAFGVSIPVFPDSSIALKLFMFFMGIGCGISISRGSMIKAKTKINKD